jgi:cytochrome c oxidase assembly factor CtaG
VLAETVAAGYSGPAPLTLWRGFTSWTLNVPAVFEIAVAAAYLIGARRLRDRGTPWPAARLCAFLAGGIGSLLVVTAGPIGCYAGVLFWVRAVQNVTLLMIVPMFVAMGAPLTMLRELASPGLLARLSRLLHHRMARRLTYPLVITPIFVGPLPLIYLTRIYQASLEHSLVGALVALWLLGAGWMYFWTRFRIDPTPRTDTYLVSLGISAAEVVLDGALGLVVWLGPLIAARYYHALARPWGPSIRVDQIIGAGILWIGGDLAGLPFLGVVLRRMTAEDAVQAAVIDAEMDRQDAERAAAPATDQVSGAEEVEQPRLWWEDHPELAERFRRR